MEDGGSHCRQVRVRVELVLHAALALCEAFPWSCVLWGACAHLCYLRLLQRLPFFSFGAALVVVVVAAAAVAASADMLAVAACGPLIRKRALRATLRSLGGVRGERGGGGEEQLHVVLLPLVPPRARRRRAAALRGVDALLHARRLLARALRLLHQCAPRQADPLARPRLASHRIASLTMRGCSRVGARGCVLGHRRGGERQPPLPARRRALARAGARQEGAARRALARAPAESSTGARTCACRGGRRRGRGFARGLLMEAALSRLRRRRQVSLAAGAKEPAKDHAF
eukprot:scaffold602_cov342-Prasinococcus_capsulatus_cf.AAC.5